MAITKLFYDPTDLTVAPPFARRFIVDDVNDKMYLSTGTSSNADWKELQFKGEPASSTEVTITTNSTTQTLTVGDSGKTFLVNAVHVTFVLPDRDSTPIGWKVTIVNYRQPADSSDALTTHNNATLDNPVGRCSIIVQISGGAADSTLGVVLAPGTTTGTIILPPSSSTDIRMLDFPLGTPAKNYRLFSTNKVGWKAQSLAISTIGGRTNSAVSRSIEPSSVAPVYEQIEGLSFAQLTTVGTEKEMFYNFSLPRDILQGTRIFPYIVWAPGNSSITQSNKTAVWRINYSVTNLNSSSSDISEPQVCWTKPVTFSIPPSFRLIVTETDNSYEGIPPMSGTNVPLLDPSAFVTLRVCRLSSDPQDTYGNPVFLLEVGFRYISTTGGTSKRFLSPYNPIASS